jgi:hypothetical protein
LAELAAHVRRTVTERIAAAEREVGTHRAGRRPAGGVHHSAGAGHHPGGIVGHPGLAGQAGPHQGGPSPRTRAVLPPPRATRARPLRFSGTRVPAAARPAIPAPVPGINKIGFIDTSDGANIRTGPREAGGQALRPEPLPPATRVFVSGTHPDAPHWLYVTAILGDDGPHPAGQRELVRGYVQDLRVTTDLPEPLARLYQVKHDDTAEGLASWMYRAAIRDGHDLRYYENVLLYVNKVLARPARAGITGTYQDPGLFGGGANNVQLVAGHRIWLVSPAFAHTLEDLVPSGSLTGGLVAKARRILRRVEDIVASIAESPDHIGEVADEYAQAIRDHLAEIIGIIVAFLLAEAASIVFAAVPGGQLIAALIQLALSAFSAAGAVQAGVAAAEHAKQWLTLAWNAEGDSAKVAAASREFLQMLVSIALAALAFTGAKASFARAVKVASSLPPGTVPALAFAGGGEQASGGAGAGALLGPPGPAGPMGTALARVAEGEETSPAPAERPQPPTLKPSVLPEYPSKPAFMAAMRRRLLAQRAAGKPSVLDFLLDKQGDWQKGSFLTKKGRTLRGRYALSDPDAQLVQAGHLQSDVYAKATGQREYLMLEDADLNWLTGQTGENLGSYVSKPAVLIDDYPLDIPTARLYESYGLLPSGTVDAAPHIEAPEF